MPIQHPENWYLRKHDDNEIFGPVHIDKIKEWADAAQVAPNDGISDDAVIWTKAPMIPELKMDYLVEVSDGSFYGPTTEGALIEFFNLGEIKPESKIINCVTGQETQFGEVGFFPSSGAAEGGMLTAPERRSIRTSLQQRVRELELALIEKNRLLQMAEDRIRKLERELQSRRKTGG